MFMCRAINCNKETRKTAIKDKGKSGLCKKCQQEPIRRNIHKQRLYYCFVCMNDKRKDQMVDVDAEVPHCWKCHDGPGPWPKRKTFVVPDKWARKLHENVDQINLNVATKTDNGGHTVHHAVNKSI